MTIGSREYAALSEDAYRDRTRDDPNAVASINGVNYRILGSSDQPSGYQGTIYQRVDTREIVVSHRGTEPSNGAREFIRDVIQTDGGMVVNGVNNQSRDAIDLTRRALELARVEGERSGQTPPVTVTGHSLGGTLAQITAHRFGLQGETFNAYGAASLTVDGRAIPEGGNSVVNHVRASDTVSAASPQFGQTRVYATPEDIAALQDAGYANNRKNSLLPFVGDPRNPLEVVWDRGGPAHDIGAFVRAQGGGPVMSPANEQRAQQFDPMIDKFRNDVETVRGGITGASQGVQDGWERVRRGVGDLFSHNGDARQAPLVSDNPMLAQTYDAIDRNGALRGLDNRAVAGLYANMHAQGLTDVNFVERGGNGALFAVQGRSPDDPAARIATANVEDQHRPVQASAQLIVNTAQAQTPPQQDAPQQGAPSQGVPSQEPRGMARA